jgi:hypothetical protein
MAKSVVKKVQYVDLTCQMKICFIICLNNIYVGYEFFYFWGQDQEHIQ